MRTDRYLFLPCIICVIIFAGCGRPQEKPVPATSTVATAVLTTTTVLATIAEVETSQVSQLMFSVSGRGVVYLVRKNNGNISVVHNGKAGKEYPITIGQVVISADGEHVAYGAMVDGKWRMVVDGREGRAFDSVIAPVFSPDGKHIIYLAKEDGKWHVVVDNKPSAGTKKSYAQTVVNAESNVIAYVEDQDKAARLVVSDMRFSKMHSKASTGTMLVTNKAGTRLAATQSVDNKKRVIDFSFADPDDVHEGRFYDVISDLTFGNDGVSLAYVAKVGDRRLLVLNDRQEPLPDGDITELPVVPPDNKVVGVLIAAKTGSFLHLSFADGAFKRELYDETANLTCSRDSRYFAYAARKGEKWFVVVNGKEGPLFDRVVTPAFSPDGTRLVYRARQNRKRFVVVADATGKTIKKHQAYEQVFQPVFTSDGQSVVYGVKEGKKLISKVEAL